MTTRRQFLALLALPLFVRPAPIFETDWAAVASNVPGPLTNGGNINVTMNASGWFTVGDPLTSNAPR